MNNYPWIKNPNSLYDIGDWLSKKMKYDQKAHNVHIQRLQVNQGEIWDCDFGQNVGHEKNKNRPVLVISNNNVNRGSKVLVVPITDAKTKMGKYSKPRYPYWYLIHTPSTDREQWWGYQRRIPQGAVTYSFLRKDSVIQLDDIRSVSKARLSNKRSETINGTDLSTMQDILSQRVF